MHDDDKWMRVGLCVLVGFGMFGLRSQDSAPPGARPINIEHDPGLMSQPNGAPTTVEQEWDGWECKQVNACPNALLIGWDKNYIGCYRILGLGCGGECTLCTGATVQYNACVEVAGAVCGPQEGGSYTNQIACGTKTTYPDCQYMGTAPANTNASPNSCYCRGTPVITTTPCYVSECER